MVGFVGLFFGTLVHLVRWPRSLLLENLALRLQLVVLKRRHPRPRLDLFDKLSWVIARRVRPAWKQWGRVLSEERLGGPHHRYNRAA